ncbi:MAG: hypothetical protein R3200_04565 [Xanthomonadales bacterium]|nr:hypothetical protein [Xanthomonadales bacterium]
MTPPDFDRLDRAYAFIGMQLYRATPVQLREIESELYRLLRLIEAYRQVQDRSPEQPETGAAHLGGTPGKE